MRISHIPKVKRHRGMTLIEVLVSLLIFSFGFLGLIGMQAKAVQISTDAEDRSRASLLANEIVSQMWTQKTLTLPALVIDAWRFRVRNQTISGLPLSDGLVSLPDINNLVTVTITWHSPSRIATASDSKYVTQVMMPIP